MHVTTDGGENWKDVTPAALQSWDKISQADAGHFDQQTAFIAINAIRKDDMKPYIYRTKDGGTTWQLIVNGLPDNGPVNVIREDPKQPGLLFAGTEREVYFSIDEGANWQTLRINMPATSVRDLVIKEDDLVVGTHGRSIWILDNIQPLRQLAKSKDQNYLYAPPTATRVRWNMFLDTPLPPEEPTGKNPPDGAILDYQLSKSAQKVSLEIIDSNGEVIRSYSSDDEPEIVDTTQLRHPTYWIRPQKLLSTEAGHHRYVWNLRHEPPRGASRSFSISAVYQNTPSGPNGPFVSPGNYTVRLTVDDQKYEQSLVVRMDPRVTISTADLKLQTDYSMICYAAYHELQDIKEVIDEKLKNARKKDKLMALRGNGAAGDPDILYGSIYAAPDESESVVRLQYKFLYMLNLLQNSDTRPTNQAISGVGLLQQSQQVILERWNKLK
jgi:hypothetical protein